MIEIIPAIAVMNNKVVKVAQGNFENVVVYEDAPIDVAQKFQDAGIKRILLIDLDGAKKGVIVNYTTLEMISRYTKLTIDFTGGVTNDGDIRLAFESGAQRIAASRIAANYRELFNQWIITYGREKIILAADSRGGKITTGDWTSTTELDVIDMIGYYHERGILHVKSTDLSKDGQLKGPAVKFYKEILEKHPDVKLIASGGVRSAEDIRTLEKIGVSSVVIGKAMHENLIDLSELSEIMA
ncbi:MAG: 1-(5-phosphoribosyl)-5-[(5-phosphoribosylamino)methylideneamino] imidazole-4-carboxamide isomerase [Cytophagales bacterium]